MAYLHPRVPACAKMCHNEVHCSVDSFHQPYEQEFYILLEEGTLETQQGKTLTGEFSHSILPAPGSYQGPRPCPFLVLPSSKNHLFNVSAWGSLNSSIRKSLNILTFSNCNSGSASALRKWASVVATEESQGHFHQGLQSAFLSCVPGTSSATHSCCYAMSSAHSQALDLTFHRGTSQEVLQLSFPSKCQN